MLMLAPDLYLDIARDSVESAGARFGGPAFHSCGDWSARTEAVKTLSGLTMVDGAFSHATDPAPNPPEAFADAFANTGIVVNARIVGGPDTVRNAVRKLWRPGMKLVVTTYCQSPGEQREVYDMVHGLCAD